MSGVTEEMKGRAAEAIGDAMGGSCMRQARACSDDPEFCGCQRAAVAALAAVAPLIAAQERERCIDAIAEYEFPPQIVADHRSMFDMRVGLDLGAAAIRALGDATDTSPAPTRNAAHL